MLRNKRRIGKSYDCSEVEREVRVQTTVQPDNTVGICFETDFGEPYTRMVLLVVCLKVERKQKKEAYESKIKEWIQIVVLRQNFV